MSIDSGDETNGANLTLTTQYRGLVSVFQYLTMWVQTLINPIAIDWFAL